MKTINDWASKWGVSQEAIADLANMFEGLNLEVRQDHGQSESSSQQQIRLEASRRGVKLFRNNVGACTDEKGNFLRYGLANDSKKMNEVVKSADLIGITPVLITPVHVGNTLGIFTSIECKAPGWTFKSTKREVAQRNWCDLILANGGIAQFATRPSDIWG